MSTLIPLNFPVFPLRIRANAGHQEIFDPARRKFVKLTPEEWVRQHLIHYFLTVLEFPISMIAVEKSITLNGLSKRFDIVIFKDSEPRMLVECKAPSIKLDQSVMDQAGRYNMVLGVPWLCITNGLDHYFCKKNETANTWTFLEEIPHFKDL